MRLYEDEVDTAMIKQSDREGTEIDVDESGCLAAYAVVMLPDAGIQQYFGCASGHMTWDEEMETFVLDGKLTVERYEETWT